MTPRELVARAGTRLARSLRIGWRRVADRWFGTDVSERQLRSALRPATDGGAASAFRGERFAATGVLEAATAALERYCSGATARTLSAAEQAGAHVFDLLGSGPVPLGTPIDWHTDFKSGHRYEPRAHSTRILPATYPGGHDIKVPWELSRFQHLAWLGQAWRLTGDERHAREFVAQVTAWIESNPRSFGVNWVCTMDVAIRVVNWLWAYDALADAPALTDDFRARFERSLLAHGRHILGNLERTGRITHNHYLSDVVGLAVLGLLCPGFREAERWREFGLRELWREVEKQVLPDGTDFEASISYHRLVTELILVPVLLCRSRGIAVPATVMTRLERMIELVLHYTRPDGGAPSFGDCDDGRLLRLKAWAGDEREWSDHRHLLAIGAVLFGRADFARAAGDEWEEALWLLGQEAVRCREDLGATRGAEPGSRLFPDGGLCFLRGGGSHAAVDAGGVGQGGIGGHAHADALGFEFASDGQPWVVDPGTGVYTADFGLRNRLRSSLAHPVLVVDGADTDRFDERDLFAMCEDARPRIERWEPGGEHDLLVAVHHGYERLVPPVSVRRVFHLDHGTGALLVTDVVGAAGSRDFTCCLPLAADIVAIEGGVARLESAATGRRLSIRVWAESGRAAVSAARGRRSPGYGILRTMDSLEIKGSFETSLRLAVLLVPERGSAFQSIPELIGLADRLADRCRREVGAELGAVRSVW